MHCFDIFAEQNPRLQQGSGVGLSIQSFGKYMQCTLCTVKRQRSKYHDQE